MLKFQYHWWALICTITSGFCGIVSVVTRVVNAATPTTTRMIAGMTVHKASRRGVLGAGVAGPPRRPGRAPDLGTAQATRATRKPPFPTAGDGQRRKSWAAAPRARAEAGRTVPSGEPP